MCPDSPTRLERKRSRIVQAAHQLFVKQGYHGTSMRQIAHKSGMALGSLYNHFDGKEDVFHAVFMQYHPYHEVMPALMNARGGTVEELVRDAANRMVTALGSRPDWLNLMFIEIVEFKSAHTSQLFNQIFPDGLQIVQDFSHLGEGKLRDVPPAILVRSFLGLFFSYYITEIILGNNAPPEFNTNALDYMVDIYLHGILERE